MQHKAIYIATLLCVPAAAALIAIPPVDPAACAGNQIPDNAVRTAATAGDNHAACSPYIRRH